MTQATELVRTKGETTFHDFRIADSRWRQAETYIFVLDPKGNMLVHPDPALEGKNELELKDITGKPIIRGPSMPLLRFPISRKAGITTNGRFRVGFFRDGRALT